ncbi:MAG: hypothetical protein NC254_07025 [bacterium]|nr:hypothetical protein [bacterium]
MGSSGNGMFGTYRGGGAGSITNGGNNGREGCPLEIENIRLEDVAISEYFLNQSDVPSVGEPVELAMQLVNKRLAVVLTSTQVVIGNLPVSYNYLNLCIKKGIRYSGKIKSSGLSPIPFIVVNLYA